MIAASQSLRRDSPEKEREPTPPATRGNDEGGLSDRPRRLHTLECDYIVPMTRRLTITVDQDVYEWLHARVGRKRIGRFLNDLARPLVAADDLAAGYEAMARDEVRELDAAAWVDQLTGDAA